MNQTCMCNEHGIYEIKTVYSNYYKEFVYRFIFIDSEEKFECKIPKFNLIKCYKCMRK